MSAPTLLPPPAYLAEDIGPTIIATASIFILLSTLFVGLRYYARRLTQTRLGAEDVIIPFAWLSEIGLCITGIVMVKKAGTGRHLDYILMTDPGKVSEHFKGIFVFEILHLPAVAFPKLCVVLLYLQVFTNKWARMATWALIYIIIATWISYTVAAMFQCIPFAFNWDKTVPNGRCFNIYIFSQSSSVPNIATDVAVIFLPIRTIMDLKVSLGRRIGLLLIFLTGSVGIIASIVRVIVFSKTDPLFDITYTHTELVHWTIIEPGMYLLAACSLSFKPLLRMMAKALHLDSLVTHTRSAIGRHTSKSAHTAKSHVEIRMETLKSAPSGGFTKLHAGYGQSDYEVDAKAKETGGFKVTVTTALDMDVEAGRGSERYESEDGVSYEGEVARAI